MIFTWNIKCCCKYYLNIIINKLHLIVTGTIIICHPGVVSQRASSSLTLYWRKTTQFSEYQTGRMRKKERALRVHETGLFFYMFVENPRMPSAVSFLIQPTDPQPLPSGADQLSPSSWRLLVGGWGKMTVTLAIDSTLTHRAPTLPQTHWFLFWLSLENTKKVRPAWLWKMDGVSFLNGYQFTA